jgi:hypothetical protein
MGHPSRTKGSGYEMKSAGFRSSLIWTSSISLRNGGLLGAAVTGG